MTMKILIIDDSPSDRFLTGRAAKEAGAEVYSFATISEARVWLESHENKPDLILTDLFVGSELGSFEVSKFAEQTPFVVCSSSSRCEDRENALSQGASDFFEKPMDSSVLGNVIAKLVKRFSPKTLNVATI